MKMANICFQLFTFTQHITKLKARHDILLATVIKQTGHHCFWMICMILSFEVGIYISLAILHSFHMCAKLFQSP